MIGQRTPLALAFRRPWPGTRRGLKLWLLSIIIGLKGVVYVAAESPASTDSALRFPVRLPHLVHIDATIPIQFWGAVIVALCLFAAFTSYCHFGRDYYGYTVLVVFSLCWAASYLVAPIFLQGPWFALQGTLQWVTIAGFVLLCAADADERVHQETGGSES